VADCNDLALLAALAGIEMGFGLAGGGARDATKHFAEKAVR
jgi:hypothetical protein